MLELHSILGSQYHKINQGIHEVVDEELDFESRLAGPAVEDWATGDEDILSELDKHGNTCLMAVLKMWPGDKNPSDLIQIINQLTAGRERGVNINAYDQKGNTALAIAARRGLFSATERLLTLGVNPNATNYKRDKDKCFRYLKYGHRSSIMQEVTEHRLAASKAKKFTLYADILKCEKALVESGAVRAVTSLIEFDTERPVAIATVHHEEHEAFKRFGRALPELSFDFSRGHEWV